MISGTGFKIILGGTVGRCELMFIVWCPCPFWNAFSAVIWTHTWESVSDCHLAAVGHSPLLWCPCFPCPSAIIEHTNRVIFLEDDDIAAVADGKLSIHRVKRSASDDPSRAIQTLQMELQQIMKGRCPLQVCVQQSQGAGVLGGAWTAVSKGVSEYIQVLGSPAGSDQSVNCPPSPILGNISIPQASFLP